MVSHYSHSFFISDIFEFYLSKIRELCNKIKSDPENINVYRDQLKSDLLNDCKEFIEKDSKILDRFVDIIIENILL